MALHRAPRTRLTSNASVGEFFSGPKRNIFGTPVFGAHFDPQSREVPPALVFIVSFLESKVLQTPGLLTTVTKYDEVLLYTVKMESGEIQDHSDIQNQFAMMEVLKIYLRELPEPLFTYELYDPLMAVNEALADASDIEIPQHLGYLKDLLRTLPYVNQLVVCYLVSFFAWVATHTETTKMSHINLGGIFGPYFLRPRGISGDYSTADAVSLLSVLIARASHILPSLEGYNESLALLNLQQTPNVDSGSQTRGGKKDKKDPFASIRPGKRKTPATIRVKNFNFNEEDAMPEAGPPKVSLVSAPPEYAVEVPRKEPFKGPFNTIDNEMYEPLFAKTLAGKDTLVYVAIDVEFGPLVLCQEKLASNAKADSIHCILFHSYGTESISAPPNCKKLSEMIKFVRVLYPTIPPQMKFSELSDPAMPNELGEYERKNMSKGAKFGLLFRRAGQSAEDEMFANNDISNKGWQEFLAFLGDKIELTGFGGFRGGLDVKDRTTGTHSVYAKLGKVEIMFHVAPMLPWYPNDKQQLERKRHIGNDLAVIVFQEDESEFNPTWLTSEMNHVFIVVTAHKDGWKVGIVTKKAVRHVEPHLPDPTIIPKNQLGREFFLTKLINVERATLHAPVFEKKLARTRRMLLENLIGESYSRRKAKMPKPSRPEGARKSLLPQIASLQRPKRASTSDVADAKAAEAKAEAKADPSKPSVSEPSLVSVTHASSVEEGEDLLTMASSKHVKKALAKRVDALYRDTDVTSMMARDLADADEDEIAAGIAAQQESSSPPPPAAPVAAAPLATALLGPIKSETRGRSHSDAGAVPKGHSRKPSNTPDTLTALHSEAKKRVAEIVARLNTYVETCSKREMLERTMTLNKIIKACNDIVDQNVQEYNPAMMPAPTKLPEAVGVSLPQLKESCKKSVSQFSEKFSGLMMVTFKVNNSADCVSLTKNIYVLETLLNAYDTSPDSLKDLPVDKPIRDPARELAAAMNSATPKKRQSGSHQTDKDGAAAATPSTPSKAHRQSGSHDKEAAATPSGTPSKPHRLSGSHTHHKDKKRDDDRKAAALATPDEPPRPMDAPLGLVKSDSASGMKPRSTGPPSLTRSLTDLRMVQERLVLAMQRTQWKLACLHRLLRDGEITPGNAAQILAQFPSQPAPLKSFLQAISLFAMLKKEVTETLSLGDLGQSQVRLVEATRTTKIVNAALDNWFNVHPYNPPDNISELADRAMRLCSDRLVSLSDAMLKTGISAVANRCTRLFRSIAKFLATQEDLLPIPPVETSGPLMNEGQQRALAELVNFLIDEAQSKLHALIHHIRGSSADPSRRWESVSQLEALERVALLLESEAQALVCPPARPLPPPPPPPTAPSTLPGISEEEMERLRATLQHSAEITENSVAAVEALTRQCQSLQMATALAALAVVLKKLRQGEPNLNLKAVRVDSTADADMLTAEQLTKLEYIRKLATTVFADTRVFMLTMSADIASSNSAPDLLSHAKLVASFKKALDDFESTNADHMLRFAP